jgi:hypothetical protein
MFRVIIFLSLAISHAFALDVAELVANPRQFQGQRVTVEGVARVQGLSFQLYRNAGEAKKYGPEDKAVEVSTRIKGPRYDQYDNRWVQVTGRLADASSASAYYGCTIFLDQVKLLARPPAGKPHVVTEVLFRNAGESDVQVVLKNERGRFYAEFPVPRNAVDGAGIRKGTAEVRNQSGRVIAKTTLLSSPDDGRYFDAKKRAYYYEIANGKIRRVTPQEAATWPDV